MSGVVPVVQAEPTTDEVFGIINVVTDLAEVDALDKAFPEVFDRMKAFAARHRIAETARLEAEIERLRGVLEPVLHWYQSDEHDERPLADILRDLVEDLRADRVKVLSISGNSEWQYRGCEVPPQGWWCHREKGHSGPCAAHPVAACTALAADTGEG